MAGFTVDTKLFQELGELLVAKETTALVELVKNAYDADATVVRVHGHELKDENAGWIVVADDGLGMTGDEFANGFLRIAGRTKTQDDRRSPVFSRRYTGEKGVGRLAAHKLARKVLVVSRKAAKAPRGAHRLPPAEGIVTAWIDWNKIEALETLDQVEASKAVVVRSRATSKGRVFASGTTLQLKPLRRGWTERMISDFLKEAVTLSPAPLLWDTLPPGLVVEFSLFGKVPVRDQLSSDPGFRVEFSGDLSVKDTVTSEALMSAGWIAEVEYDRESGDLRMAVSPTKAALAKYPTSEGFKFLERLGPGAGPSFRARVLQRSRSLWDSAVRGIRVFMEGFRVPPYGDQHDDWLALDHDYMSRARRRLTSLSNIDVKNLPDGMSTEELSLQGNAAYMGAVFLHRSSSPELEMLVNREGFLPGPGLDFVKEWMRVAIGLIVRLGYAARKETDAVKREDKERQRQVARRSDVGETPTALRVRESAERARHQLDVAKSAIEAHDFGAAAAAVSAAQPHFEEVRTLSNELGGEAVLWRVLASLGSEMAAFVHEINALALEASAVVADLDQALEDLGSPQARGRVRSARQASFALVDRIRRNATYLVDATSFQGRRRRSRVPLHERFEATVPLFEARMRQRGIALSNEIPADLLTPPMFPSELAGIFTNLLSNAVKFTEDGGRIAVSARIENGSMFVRMENTGTAVDLRRASRLFDAFQSTTRRPDPLLGQGMGMGLTITRAFVQEYGGTIAFVPPTKDFETAVEFEDSDEVTMAADIIYIDDEPDALLAAAGDNRKRIAEFRYPELNGADVPASMANLWVVDFFNEERQRQQPDIEGRNSNGLSVFQQFRLLVGDARPPAVLVSNHLEEALGGDLPLTRPHVLAERCGVEWVANKSAPDLVARLFALADATGKIRSVADKLAGAEPADYSSVLANEVLALSQEPRWAGRAVSDVSTWRPPAWRVDVRDARLGVKGLKVDLKLHSTKALVAWLIRQVLPHPSFLVTDRHVAVRLRLRLDCLRAATAEKTQLRQKLELVHYAGVLTNFVDSRWWDAGVDAVNFELPTGGEERTEALKQLVAPVELQELEIPDPVVVSDADLVETDEIASANDCVRAADDAFPAHAPPAWVKIQAAREDHVLAKKVHLDDQSALAPAQ